MGRDVRFNRRRAGMAAIAGLAALVALIATASAPASHYGAGSLRAGHTCLVMTGSGDPAGRPVCVRNRQPFGFWISAEQTY